MTHFPPFMYLFVCIEKQERNSTSSKHVQQNGRDIVWNGDQIGKAGNSSNVSVPVYKEGNVIHRKMFFCCGCQNAAGCVFCCASTYAKNSSYTTTTCISCFHIFIKCLLLLCMFHEFSKFMYLDCWLMHQIYIVILLSSHLSCQQGRFYLYK